MAKITNPIRFSKHFGCDPKLLKELGVLNPTLNADVRLFIDPLLLEGSLHQEMCAGAHSTYQQHFTTVIKLLRGCQQENDAAWKGAVRLLSFPEIKWTCLGYGANSVSEKQGHPRGAPGWHGFPVTGYHATTCRRRSAHFRFH